MKALQLQEIGKPLEYVDLSPPPETGIYVSVQVLAAGLNHRDLWIQQGQYAGIQTPIILGSDAMGIYKDKKVILNPSMNWTNQSLSPPKTFKILGLPNNGTFAESVLVPARNIFPKPGHLSTVEAAALPLAGLTAYRVLFSRCKLGKNSRVLITGIGGGVALMALQFALSYGNEVWVTSGSPQKIKKAVGLGAQGGVLYTDDDWDKQLLAKAGGGFDVIVDSAAGKGFKKLIKVANPGARVGLYGGTTGKIDGVIPQAVFWKQLTICGSTMGSTVEFRKMLSFVNKHQIVPVIDKVFTLKEGNKAFQRMKSGKQFGKIVLKIE